MTVLTAIELPEVALDFMNHDHQQAAEQISDLQELLSDAIDDPDKTSEVTEKLTAIYNHTEQHFAREESEMQGSGFPAYGCHKAEHERVLEELRQVAANWQADNDIMQLNSYINDTLKGWLVNHIATMDTVTAMFINRQKI